MEIRSRHIGGSGDSKSAIIEITIESWSGCTITEDVTDLHGAVDEEFILSLREIADELEEQNKKLKQ